MNILGISAYYHDSAACIISKGKIVAAVQEERFTRLKNDPSFPKQAVAYCLEEAGLSLEDINVVAYYEKPLLKFERLLYTFLDQAPKGYLNFLKSMPIWIKQKLMLRGVMKKELKSIYPDDKVNFKFIFPEHHLSHAASAYYVSGFSEAAILTIDGVGEWDTACIYHGESKNISKVKSIRYPDSLGLLYSAFTSYLGFKVNSGEYKMMGLAPYGNSNSNKIQQYVDSIKAQLVTIESDGSFSLNQKYFDYLSGRRMFKAKAWNELFGLPPRKSEPLKQEHCDLAKAIQIVTEEIVVKLAAHAVKVTGSSNLCLAGGVALNCVANGKIHNLPEVKNLFIQPAAGDAGAALGAALLALHTDTSEEAFNHESLTNNSLLGPSYSPEEIEDELSKYKLEFTHFEDENEAIEKTAQYISDGFAVGWFQGRSEFGPRALGNRSILADPRNVSMQSKLNLKIKNRESFRPFAPAVLEEDVSKHFEIEGPSPFMLLVKQVKKEELMEIPDEYFQLTLEEKLKFNKSNLPAITHVDFSARIQTVNEVSNSKFYKLIKAFKALSGYGVLVNTSFNKRDEPIVNSPKDAIDCFLNTDMDCLILGNHIIVKNGVSK